MMIVWASVGGLLFGFVLISDCEWVLDNGGGMGK